MTKYFLEDPHGWWIKSLDYPGSIMTYDPLKAWDFGKGSKEDATRTLLEEFTGYLTQKDLEYIESIVTPAKGFIYYLKREGINLHLKIREQEFFEMSNGELAMFIKPNAWITVQTWNNEILHRKR